MTSTRLTRTVYDPQRFVVFLGWPGTGKTTLAHSTLDNIAGCIVNKDSIAMPMTQDVEGELYKKIIAPGSYKAMYNIAEDNLKRGQTVVIESPFHNVMKGEVDANLVRISEETKSPLKIIICTAPDPLILERIIKRGEPRDAPKIANWAEYTSKAHKYAATMPHLHIDTSQNHDQSVRQVLEYLAIN